WSANEQATTYGTDLKLVGAVSLAPMADMTGMAEAAATKTLTPDQLGVYVWMLMGVEGTHPDFPIDEYRRGIAKTKWDALRGCLGNASVERIRVLYELTPDDLIPATPEATERLTKIFQSMALPQQRGAAPMLVIYGGADSFVRTEWTRNAIAQACAMGTQIATVFQPDRGHLDLKVDEFAGWLMARIEGFPAPDTCQAP
ncbi:MAG: lipase, partial [Mycobacterium sp.]